MLEIKQLEVAYGDHQVLKKLEGQFAWNEIHGIVGMNGAGKTTLFNSIYGMIKSRKGQCLLDGAPVQSRQIAYLETRNFFYPYLHGRDYLQLLSLSNTDFSIDKWNQLFSLPLDMPVDQYSTGMKKKLAFMGILALNRPILILDEPFNGVDVESNEKIRQILERVRSENKIVLLSSHIMGSLTNICDRISYMSDGHFVETYDSGGFANLEAKLKSTIKQQIEGTLDELF